MSLTQILGHNRLRELIETMGDSIHRRAFDVGIKFTMPDSPIQTGPDDAARYIATYFRKLHPLSPFLDRQSFEEMALGPGISELLAKSAAFNALYHTVLALGCQYIDGGSFDPGEGKAWKYFQIALGLFPKLLVPIDGLVHVQALTAMAIFAMNFSCIQISDTLISEAARLVQVLGYNAAYVPGNDEKACHRVFWVIYWQERVFCFFRGRASMIPEYDIGCPVPDITETPTDGLDWLLVTARLGRLMSRMYECLFSVSAVQMPKETRLAAIESMFYELEVWRGSVPEELRPNTSSFSSNADKAYGSAHEMRTQLQFLYYALIVSLCRLRIHLSADQHNPSDQEIKLRLMEAARSIIYLSRHIEHEPHVPVWEIGMVPISALFVIFDFVVHNPLHQETNINLAFLDIASGYFSRWEVSHKGSFPEFSISEFSHIAREFVRDSHIRSQQEVPVTEGISDQRSQNNGDEPLDPSAATGSFAALSGYLFYPEDPLQPVLGNSMLAATDLSSIFNAPYWPPYTAGF
ncbi:hypothetical protein UA08_07601 [Talaromyces atroroseus]|uniref:Xylanolytic transcriptional activator regulatory domain-containing protein n=1 Tax=Talaromyces atroroseus TaxID=1441469 RepID=A0A225AUW8_TALAT|nr:hypothetical protein UA08_07601 [Talaromyces atroroseus]OKL57267.1 hypothetical protein UA08_07601 [Talaromyces atroroseus]